MIHCWGPGPHFTTVLSNVKDRQQSIALADLPATFQDAITICWRLEFEHILIESLCIIQDSEADWRAESTRMGDVYAGAILTIVAEASADSHSEIFAPANAGRPPPPLRIPCKDSRGAQIGTVYTRPEHKYGKTDQYDGGADIYKAGPVGKRAWTYQENIMASRILRYAEDQLFWACLTCYHNERNPVRFEIGNEKN